MDRKDADQTPTPKHVNLRLPADLHARVEAAASREHRSLNSYIIVALERAVEASQRQ